MVVLHITELREKIRQQLIAAAAADPRVAGLVEGGAGAEGRGDDWSDLDVALFLRDEAYDAFVREWQAWAAQFGDLLLAYVGGVGHPWTVYAAEPLPLRVDFAFLRLSAVDELRDWSVAPASVDHMVLYDDTGGRIRAEAARLVGQSLAPADLQATFERVSGDFWYYCLRTYTRLWRGELWVARHEFNWIVMGNLFALLRLESGVVDRWRATSAATGLARDVSPARLAQLEECVPGPGAGALLAAMRGAAGVGAEVCAAIAATHNWPWPSRLARQVQALLARPLPSTLQ
jgi:hypothetical protein